MPRVSEMLPSRYLRKTDIDADTLVTIRDVTLENMPGDAGEQRWIAHFRELPRGLVLNATTIRTLERAFGADSDDWRGKRVTLFVDESVAFRGAIVGGLRLRPKKPDKTAAAPTDDFNDEVPF